MAFPNSSISDIIATTIQSRSRKIADNVTKNNALLAVLNEKGNVRTATGGDQIFEEFSFAENGNFQWYSGYDLLSVGAQDVISGANFAWKQCAVAVAVSGLEKMQNSGKERMIDIVAARVKVAESTMENKITEGIYSDGTASGSKTITGLQASVVALPTTGTYGGVDRAVYTFWRNQYTGSLGAPAAATIQGFMNTLWLKMVRGKDKTNLILFDNTSYSAYENSLQLIQRITSNKTAALGFDNIMYKSAPVVADGGIGGFCPSGTGYFLNTDYIFLRPHKDRNMVALDPETRSAVNQDAEVKFLAWMGNMTCSNMQLQGFMQNY